MKKIILLLALGLAVGTIGCTSPTDPIDPVDTLPADPPAQGYVVRNATLNSNILNRAMTYSVYLPAGYDAALQYPVLYLLHGYNGDQNDWFVYDNLAAVADSMIAAGELPPLIIVTPYGGNWMYIDNYYNNGINYEAYFFQEFIPHVEAFFNVRQERSARFIGGFSMGGYGSLRYGIVHHDMFAYVYAMSALISGFGVPSLDTLVANYTPADLPGITLECGNSDFFTDANRAFDQRLTQLGIQHQYITRAGGHTWDFWSSCTPSILRQIGAIL